MEIYLNGIPVERSSEFEVKLTKKEKAAWRKMRTRKETSGSLTIELPDLYKEFRNKVKAQIKQRER